MLAISDTGQGMDTETQSRIFEPFFTTKEHGKGTGLGLATVHGIVKQSNGHIWVYSEPNQGTTFKVYLPRVEQSGKSISVDETAVKPQPGMETVLLVEDEDMVRELANRILLKGGYHVLEAQNATQALEISKHHENHIDVLLTDVVMPGGMSGRQLVEQLKLQRVNMKVLYMSGYTDDAVMQHGISDSGTAFLQKPFSPDTLLRKIREILDSNRVTSQ
jgi:CheY-like chemotaxis protein